MRLEQAVRALTDVLAQDVVMHRASLQQLYTLDDLQVRYGGMGRDALISLLKRCDVWPADAGPGKTTRIHLESVLKVDAVLAGRIHLPPAAEHAA